MVNKRANKSCSSWIFHPWAVALYHTHRLHDKALKEIEQELLKRTNGGIKVIFKIK